MARPPATALPVRPPSARALRRRSLAAAAALAVTCPVLLPGTASAATTETPGASGALSFSQVLKLGLQDQQLALFQAKGRSTASRPGKGSTTIEPQEALAFAGVVGGTPAEQTPAQLQEFNGALATLDDPGPIEKEPHGLPAPTRS